MSESRRSVVALVSGRVQAVGFRAYVASTARGLPVAGWVRNLDDGRVEARAEGPAPAVEELLAALREGPPSAVVDHVEVTDADPEDLDGFSVR